MATTIAGALSGSAQASAPTKCGEVITTSTTLVNDVGPCSKTGLIVQGNGITLNLNGHTVFGKDTAAQSVGVLMSSVTGSTVENGTVTGFDAGIAVNGGSGNTVTGINAHDNIDSDTGSQTATHSCIYGDGITTTSSSDNLITGNTVVHNGPFSGISLVEQSSGNTVSSNTVADNNVPNSRPNGTGNCGAPFSRPIQDIGIRVEGPGAQNNTVKLNRVTNSALGGITIHGYVYNQPSGGPPDQPNSGNLIEDNFVQNTGMQTYTIDPLADGIGVLRQGPSNVVGVSQGNTISGNTVLSSYRNGIYLGNPTQPGPLAGNTVTGNTVQYSLFNGIYVAAVTGQSANDTLTNNTANSNGADDGYDGNVSCDNDLWSGNVFNFVNQSCVDASAAIR